MSRKDRVKKQVKNRRMAVQANEPESIQPRASDGLRQLAQPPEFRIRISQTPLGISYDSHAKPETPNVPVQTDIPATGIPAQTIAEIATLLWYLKTKYFKRDWNSGDANVEDPRDRRALLRLERGIDALKQYGIEIEDPTNKRYPQGGSDMMVPLQFVPTEGVGFERVTETASPIVFHRNTLIKRGEVFVAVPMEQRDSVPVTTIANPPPDRGEASAGSSEKPPIPAETSSQKLNVDSNVGDANPPEAVSKPQISSENTPKEAVLKPAPDISEQQ
jgi:hypothetical protein